MRFDSLYTQILSELFNTKGEYIEWGKEEGAYVTNFFGPDNIEYSLMLEPYWDLELPSNILDEVPLSPEQYERLKKGTWSVEFRNEYFDEEADEEEDTEYGITGDLGMDATKVFSIVGNAIVDKVSKQPKVFRNLAFSAKEPSRRSLYAKLSQILAKKLNKDLVMSNDKSWFFIISRQ